MNTPNANSAEARLGVSVDFLGNRPHLAAILAHWYFGQWGRFYGNSGVREIQRQIQARANLDRIPLTLVASIDRLPLGSVCLKHSDKDPAEVWFSGLFVVKAFRRHGIGELLMDRAIAEAKRLGLGSLKLWTPTAEHYYRRRGWNVIKRISYRGQTAAIMHFAVSPQDRAEPQPVPVVSTLATEDCLRDPVSAPDEQRLALA